MDFIVNNLPMILFAVLGIGLLVVEMFMPGFGLPGIAGIALLIASVVITWMEFGAMAGLGMAVILLALSALAVIISMRSAASGRLSRSPLILKGSHSKEEGFISQDTAGDLLGKEGITLTVLRPAGLAAFDDERVNVVSAGEFIPKDARVIVKEVEGARVLVEIIQA